MAKEYSKQCPDCDGIDIMGSGLFSSKGNGRCSNCHGKGRVPDVMGSLAAPFVGCDTDEVCNVCPGNGQCQTCGGEGYIYYNEDYPGGDDQREDNHESSYDPYYESSSSGSYGGSGGGGSSSSGDSASGCLGIIAFIFIVALVAAIWEHRSSPGVTYVSQPAQPTGSGNQASTDTPDTTKAAVSDTISRDSIGFADPDTNKVKSDLLGKKMTHWSFDNASEFLELKIVKRDTLKGRLFLSAELELQSLSSGKRYHAMTLLGYDKGPDAWQFSTIDETLFNEESSGDPAAIPSVSRQYADLDAAGYETTGDIVFSTSCTDCSFQSLISGQKQEVAYLRDDPYSVPSNAGLNPLKLQPGLYEFSIFNAAGQKHTFKAYIKPNTRLFIRVDKK